MDLKLFIKKTMTFSHNILFNYTGLLSVLFFAISYFSFTYFQNEQIHLVYYTLLLTPIFYGFAFIYQLGLFVKNKITLEGHVFKNLLENLHPGREKAFYDNFFPFFLIMCLSSFYCLGLIFFPRFIESISLLYQKPFDNFASSFLLFSISSFYVFISCFAFKILQKGNLLLSESISVKNEYCSKHEISAQDSSDMMFTLYDGNVINVLFDDLIVNVKKDEAIYKKKKYKHTALNSYLNETGLTLKELSPSDWAVVDFMSI